MSIQNNKNSRFPSSSVLKGSIDATLAANLPAVKQVGDVYDISVAGSFENSALILPASAYFSVPDQIRWNGTNWVKMEAGDNISDAAFDASWDGNVNNAPSKNAVYDKQLLTDAAILEPQADQGVFGFLDRAETTLSFDPVTYTLTLGSVGASWSYYRAGQKYTIAGSKTFTLTGNPTIPDAGKFFIYIDSAIGTLQSGPVWTLEDDDTKVPVAVLCWNNALTPKYCLFEERHEGKFTRKHHLYAHSTVGTQLEPGGGALADYSVAQSSPTNAHNTFSIGQAKIWDEDILNVCGAIADNGPYHVAYRTALGVWTWIQPSVPFKAGTYIQYDNAGTMTDLGNNEYVNIYLLATNANANAAWTMVHGQAKYSSLALAQAEKFGNLTMTGFPIQECVAVWQITYQTGNSYTSTGKCRIAATPVRVNTSLVQAVSYPGLGTMSTQNADAVDITGGSIGSAVTATTQAVNNDSTLIATTAFVRAEVYDLTNKTKDVATQTYTVDATDQGQTIFFTYAGAVTITLPISMPKGESFTCVPVGATTTLAFTTSGGATLAAKGGLYNVTDQYSPATAVHRGSNAWYLFGNLS